MDDVSFSATPSTVADANEIESIGKSIAVPLVQMNVLLGFVADAFMATILGLGLPRETEVATLRAFNKLLWLQNDLIARHYVTR